MFMQRCLDVKFLHINVNIYTRNAAHGRTRGHAAADANTLPFLTPEHSLGGEDSTGIVMAGGPVESLEVPHRKFPALKGKSIPTIALLLQKGSAPFPLSFFPLPLRQIIQRACMVSKAQFI